MANSTKPGLTAVTTPALTDLLSVRQSGDTRDKKETLAQVRALVNGDLSIGTVSGGVLPLSSAGGNTIAFQPVAGIDALRLGTVASGINYATITPGAAGNNVLIGAAGGDTNIGITFTPKGTGQTLFPAGTKAAPGIAFTAAPTRGIYAANAGTHFVIAGNNTIGINNVGIHVKAGQQFLFSAGDPDSASPDAGFLRLGAGVIQPTNGSSGFGQLQCDGSTGAGMPLFGTNSPASSLANPYSWLKFKASDGTQVFVPAWA